MAIDFGTSASSAILVTGQSSPDHQLVDREGRVWWESAVCWSNGRMWVGAEAKSRQANRAYSYRNQFKRALRDGAPMVLGDDEFTPAELVSAVLREMRRRAGERHAPGVRRVVLTVPPSYTELGDPRADLMVQAGLDAGFDTVELLPEPMAAGLLASDGHFPDGSQVLVYDFGGGTFDAALVEVGGVDADHRVPAVSIDRCGGTDIDASIARWLLDDGAPELAGRITPDMRSGVGPSGLADMMDLAECCDRLKRSVDGDEPGVVSFRSEVELTLPAKVLRELAAPWVEMTIRCCRDLLRAEGVAAGSLAGVLLVGGSSQLPMVHEELSRAFGRPVSRAPDPQLTVVKGAARFARQSAGRVRGQVPGDVSERPVRWRIPGGAGPHSGGTGRLLRWRVDPGDAYAEGDLLAEVRLPLGSIYRLRADGSGVVAALHASPGQPVRGGDWLLTARVPPRQWAAGRRMTDAAGIAAVIPAVHRGRVFTGTVDGVVEARVAATGELCWRRFAGAEVTAPITATGAAIYVGCADGGLHVLAAETGEPLAWRLGRVGKAIRTAPVIAGETVFFGSDDGRLHAAIRPEGHASTAVRVHHWQPGEGGRAFGSNIIGTAGSIREPLAVSDGVVYAMISGSLHAVLADPSEQDGLSVRSVAAQALAGTGIAHFTVEGGTVYACCDDNVLRAFDVTGDGQIAGFPPESGEQAADGLGALGARMGAWARKTTTRPRPLFSTTPVLATGADEVRVLYVGTSDGRVLALDAATLALAGIADAAAAEITGLAVAGSTVFAGSADGWLCALSTADAGLVERWRFHAGSKIPAAPAVAEGSVFVTTAGGHLHALDAAAGPRRP